MPCGGGTLAGAATGAGLAWGSQYGSSVMRFVALFAVVIFALPIAGCSLAIRSQGIEATDLSAIVVGADRETVEGVLGSTIDRVETETGRI